MIKLRKVPFYEKNISKILLYIYVFNSIYKNVITYLIAPALFLTASVIYIGSVLGERDERQLKDRLLCISAVEGC